MEKQSCSYEAVLVLSLKENQEFIDGIVKKLSDLINSHGTLDGVDVWGKKKLAYAIEKQTEGYYVLFNFTCEKDFPCEFERICRITDGILRSLVVKKEGDQKTEGAI